MAYQSGETIAAPDAADCLETFNDLLGSISTDQNFVFGSGENILSWTAGKNQYRVGNPTCSLVGSSPFTGTLTSGSNVITGVTNIPANLVAGAAAAYAVGSGSILTDTQGLLPTDTTVTAIGTTTVTVSANATGNSNGADSFVYTVPGDFPIQRPLRITHGFTRFNNLDFTLDVCQTESQYTSILFKAQPGPWPTVAWYNDQFPYGVLNVYQTPSNGAALHLFTDTILDNMTLNQVLVMPQGYSRMLKLLLMRDISIEYGIQLSPLAIKLAQEAVDFIKALNAQPAAVSRYDRQLTRGNRANAGWILTGGM
jgi:hypothetical protein